MKQARLVPLLLATLLLGACNSSNDDDSVQALNTGLYTLESDGIERSYYVIVPESDNNAISPSASDLKPLVIGFHGSFGSHLSWIGDTDRYGFTDEVGDDAIMIFPDAMELADGQINWNFDVDFLFFEDILAELDRLGVEYDKNRLFVTGHSSGAGLAYEIACRYGDIVRAAAISSGSLISTGACIGSVALIQTQGETDELVPLNVGGPANEFWVRYNGHTTDSSKAGVIEPCIDYANLDFGIEPYPVQWCQHPGGHAWTSFNSEAYWTFFTGLPLAEPTAEAPPGGGNEAAELDSDTTLSFTLEYPPDIAPVVGGAITLFTEDYEDGQFRAPDIFLNPDWDPNVGSASGSVTPGETIFYEQIPITFFVFGGTADLSATYKMQFSIYVEGGSQPIPTPGVDHKVIYEITFVDQTTPVIISETLPVLPVEPFTN